MQRASFKVELNETLKEEKKQLVERLSQNRLALKFLKDHECEKDFLSENAFIVEDYARSVEKCTGCKGLAFCVQEKEGYLINLVISENEVHKEITKCKYALKKEHDLDHSHKLLLNDMSDAQLHNQFKMIDLEVEKPKYIALVKALMLASKHPSSRGFYMCGEPGVGKTYLATCFVNEMAKQGKRCSFVHVPTMIANLKTMMYDHHAFRRMIYAMKTCQILVLDDIGGESASSWSRDDILLPLLNERMEMGLLTLFTSNYSQEKLEKFYTLKSKAVNDVVGAKRLIERVRAMASEEVLVGSNRRVENAGNKKE